MWVCLFVCVCMDVFLYVHAVANRVYLFLRANECDFELVYYKINMC